MPIDVMILGEHMSATFIIFNMFFFSIVLFVSIINILFFI